MYINSVSLVPPRISMYADDILLSKLINHPDSYDNLQRDIDAIQECITTAISKCDLTLNPTKCKYLIASRRRQPHLSSTTIIHWQGCSGTGWQLPLPGCTGDIKVILGRPYQPYMQQSQETCWNAIQAVLHLGWHKHTASHLPYLHTSTLRVCVSVIGPLYRQRHSSTRINLPVKFV